MPTVLNPAEMAALVAAITVLVSVVKPFLEAVVPPGAVMHDPLLRLLVFVLSLGSVIGVAVADGTFTSGNAVLLLSQAIVQAGASIGAYQVIARSGGAVSAGPAAYVLPATSSVARTGFFDLGPVPPLAPRTPAFTAPLAETGPGARPERAPGA